MDCLSEAHNAVVTSAIFAPNPGLMVSLETSEKQEAESKGEDCEISDTIPSGRCFKINSAWYNGMSRKIL